MLTFIWVKKKQWQIIKTTWSVKTGGNKEKKTLKGQR